MLILTDGTIQVTTLYGSNYAIMYKKNTFVKLYFLMKKSQTSKHKGENIQENLKEKKIYSKCRNY